MIKEKYSKALKKNDQQRNGVKIHLGLLPKSSAFDLETDSREAPISPKGTGNFSDEHADFL